MSMFVHGERVVFFVFPLATTSYLDVFFHLSVWIVHVLEDYVYDYAKYINVNWPNENKMFSGHSHTV